MSDEFRASAPSPGPPRPYHFPHVTRETLPNGLKILIAENHNAPVVAIRALVGSGADRDTPELAGLASMTSKLLDEGAGDRDAIKLAEDLGLLGASLAAGTDWDASYVSVDVLSKNLGPTLDIFADVIRRPMLPPPALERQRSERLMDLLQQREEPGIIAGKRFAKLLYGSGTYGNTVMGNPESVSRLSIEDVRQFYAENFIPNNTAIIIAGDIDTKRIIADMTRLFADWKRGASLERPPITPSQIDRPRVYLIDRPNAVQSEIRIGHIGVPRRSADYFPLTVMNALLGGVFNSRINLNLREQHGYTYGARSVFAFRRQAGPFVVSAPVRNEVTLESVTEMMNELRRIRTGDIEQRELEDTKNYLAGSFPSSVQSSSDIAGRILDMELYELPHDYFDHYRENITSVKAGDVARVANKYIDPDRAIIVIVGNAAQVREPLGTLGYPIHDLDVDGNLLPVG